MLPLLPLAAILLQGVAAQAGQESGYTLPKSVSNAKGQDKYTMYTGNGDDFPSMSDWESYEDLWNGNKDLIQSSCSTWSVPNNSDTEMQNLHDEIQSVSTSANIDPRFTLAILLQESSGCVRVPTTNNGVTNPGLMQSHAGTGTCNDGSGNVQTPCPKSEIHQMIADGVTGTSGGDGLKQILDEYGPKPYVAKSYYRAARVYNSGQLDGEDLNDGFDSTACYVNDIANRLTGWVHAKEHQPCQTLMLLLPIHPRPKANMMLRKRCPWHPR
ncbi:hypothetical protein KEM55_004894 [Ascosphaera atra]|nr:hypothetical protein KEM55_004894 [Ascosphaera atra]